MAAASVLAACGALAGQNPPAPSATHENDPILQEVLANLRGQGIGSHTVADLALPEDFLVRVADRITRASFEQNFRIVVQEEHSPSGDARETGGEPAAGIVDGQPSVIFPARQSWRPLIVVVAITIVLAVIARLRRGVR